MDLLDDLLLEDVAREIENYAKVAQLYIPTEFGTHVMVKYDPWTAQVVPTNSEVGEHESALMSWRLGDQIYALFNSKGYPGVSDTLVKYELKTGKWIDFRYMAHGALLFVYNNSLCFYFESEMFTILDSGDTRVLHVQGLSTVNIVGVQVLGEQVYIINKNFKLWIHTPATNKLEKHRLTKVDYKISEIFLLDGRCYLTTANHRVAALLELNLHSLEFTKLASFPGSPYVYPFLVGKELYILIRGDGGQHRLYDPAGEIPLSKMDYAWVTVIGQMIYFIGEEAWRYNTLNQKWTKQPGLGFELAGRLNDVLVVN